MDVSTIAKAFEMAANPIIYGITVKLNLSPETWQLFYELGAAITGIYNDRTAPESWLLKQPHMTINGVSQVGMMPLLRSSMMAVRIYH